MSIRNHSLAILMFILLVSGMTLTPTVTAGTIFDKNNIITSPTGKLILAQTNIVPLHISTWNDLSNIPSIDSKPKTTNESFTPVPCGYSNSLSLIGSNPTQSQSDWPILPEYQWNGNKCLPEQPPFSGNWASVSTFGFGPF